MTASFLFCVIFETNKQHAHRCQEVYDDDDVNQQRNFFSQERQQQQQQF